MHASQPPSQPELGWARSLITPADVPADAIWGTNSLGNHYWKTPDGQFGYYNRDGSSFYNDGQAGPRLSDGNSTYVSPEGHEFGTLKTSEEDGYLYEVRIPGSDQPELRWKDEAGTVYRKPKRKIVPISLGGKRDPETHGLVWGEKGWEPRLWDEIEESREGTDCSGSSQTF